MTIQTLLRGAFILFVLKPLFRIFFRTRSDGRACLPGTGPLIIAANHDSHLDVLALLAALPLSFAARLRPVAAEDYFGGSGAGMRGLRALLGILLVRRGGPARLDHLEAALSRGESLLIFPEGTRGQPGHLRPFKGGAALLAARVPAARLVPAALLGTGACLPKGARIPRPGSIRVRFGRTLRPGAARKESTRALEAEVRELLECASPLRVSVVGIDGSGKSSCFLSLARRFGRDGGACGVGDVPLMIRRGAEETLGWLPGAARRSFFHTRAKACSGGVVYELWKALELLCRPGIARAMAGLSQARVIFFDGDPLINMAAWTLWRRGPLGARTVLAAAGLLRMRLPDLVLQLRVAPERAVERIAGRGERRQAHETCRRLRKLQAGYDRALRLARRRFGLRVVSLETDGMSKDEVLAAAAAAVDSIGEGRVYGKERTADAARHRDHDLGIRRGLGKDPAPGALVRA